MWFRKINECIVDCELFMGFEGKQFTVEKPDETIEKMYLLVNTFRQ